MIPKHYLRGRFITQQVKLHADPVRNPLVDRCTFGNFEVKHYGVCDEWRTRDGQSIAKEDHESR